MLLCQQVRGETSLHPERICPRQRLDIPDTESFSMHACMHPTPCRSPATSDHALSAQSFFLALVNLKTMIQKSPASLVQAANGSVRSAKRDSDFKVSNCKRLAAAAPTYIVFVQGGSGEAWLRALVAGIVHRVRDVVVRILFLARLGSPPAPEVTSDPPCTRQQ